MVPETVDIYKNDKTTYNYNGHYGKLSKIVHLKNALEIQQNVISILIGVQKLPKGFKVPKYLQ